MGYPQKRIAHIAPEEYLALEHRATAKHEYLDGVIYAWQGHAPQAMAGGTLRHNRVSLNVASSLRNQLKGSGCEVFMADVRLNKADRTAYFYPDVVVTCSATDLAREDGISEPSLVVEVLSDSTEDFDRGDKFTAYRDFPSLKVYVLVSPERRTMEVFHRDANWAPSAASDTSLQLNLAKLVFDHVEIFEGF